MKDFSVFRGFSCLRPGDTDRDLDDFIQNDAERHFRDKVAVTYLLESQEEPGIPFAFATLQNDAIVVKEADALPDYCIQCEHRPTQCKDCARTVANGKGTTARSISDIVDEYVYTAFPAVKIGRFGVHIKFQNPHPGKEPNSPKLHLGSIFLQCLKVLMLEENRTGCRFITVDARKDKRNKVDVTNFYKKNGFFEFPVGVRKRTSRYVPMYFDLGRFDSLHKLP